MVVPLVAAAASAGGAGASAGAVAGAGAKAGAMAGAKQAGSISIKGFMDNSNILQGLKGVSSQIDSTKAHFKEAAADFKGLIDTVSGILGPLGKIGGALTLAAIGMAALGPATQPALARMHVAFYEITRSLSEALEPAFEAFAGLMEDFGSWLDGPQGQAIMGGLNFALTLLVNTFDALGGTVSKFVDGLMKIPSSVGSAVTFGIDTIFGEGTTKWLVESLIALPGQIGTTITLSIDSIFGDGTTKGIVESFLRNSPVGVISGMPKGLEAWSQGDFGAVGTGLVWGGANMATFGTAGMGADVRLS